MLFVLISIVFVIFLCVEFEVVRHFVAKIFFGTLAVAILVYGACALQNVARAEPNHSTVVIVYYDEDTFIAEDDNGRRDLYDDRGDLVPGDELLINGDNVVLDKQSNWIWYDIYYKDDVAASFLYTEDAAEVMSHVKEVKIDG